MRGVVLCLVLVVGAGCLDLPRMADAQPASAPAMEAFQEATPGFLQAIGEADAHSEEWSIRSTPYMVRMGTLEGPADYARLQQVLGFLDSSGQVRHGFWTPDHVWLLHATIPGYVRSAWVEDGNVTDGMAAHWRIDYMVQWQEGRWSEWSTTWSGGQGRGYSSTTGGSVQADPRDCGAPPMASWQVDSDAAVALAMEQAAFGEHVVSEPDGEMWLRFSWGDAHLNGCAEDWAPHWRIRWMDADRLPAGAPFTEVRIDAAAGVVNEVWAGVMDDPANVTATLLAEGKFIQTAGSLEGRSRIVDVPRVHVLQVHIRSEASLPGIRVDEARFILESPSGTLYTDDFGIRSRFSIQDPEPGPWTLHYDDNVHLDTGDPVYVYEVLVI